VTRDLRNTAAAADRKGRSKQRKQAQPTVPDPGIHRCVIPLNLVLVDISMTIYNFSLPDELRRGKMFVKDAK
jgi:hypothetical protein